MADERDHSRDTDIRESDPNADSAAGLAGDMGVSSERTGPLRGGEESTHGAEYPAEPEDDEAPPEQSADPATGEVTPSNELPEHPFDPGKASGHSHG